MEPYKEKLLKDYKDHMELKNEIFNLIVQSEFKMITNETWTPISIYKKQYDALNEYTKVLNLRLKIEGVEIPDIY